MSTSLTDATGRVISLRGVRTHNLKAVDLDLPVNRLIVVTGVSGAGKGSLAFDTVYAEGQRRYVETFSPYTRQFLEKLDKPDADLIMGIPPAIGVPQTKGRHSSRSTIGTITETHDALGLLFARAGQVFCLQCGQNVLPATGATVARSLEALPAGTRYEIAFPVDLRAETDWAVLAASLRADGFTRARIGGQLVALDSQMLELPAEGTIDVVVDRLTRALETPERLADSIETAFQKGLGRCRVLAGEHTATHVRTWRCSRCGKEHRAPEPDLFRYASAVGACPVCEGLGQTMELDLGRIVPDPSRTIRQGAIAPWSTPAYRLLLEGLLKTATDLDIPVDAPFESLAPEEIARLVEGVPGTGFGGLRGFLKGLERKAYRLEVRVFLNRWRRYQACPACRGARLRSEALTVKIAEYDIAAVLAMPITAAQSWIAGLVDLRSRPAAAAVLTRIESRLGYLESIGLGYLTLDRAARTLSGGELQRVILTKALGSGLVSTLYVLDEPAAGLHPREVGRLVAILKTLRDRGNTVLAIEHDHEVIRGSDHVVDLGPGAGQAGGQILYAGPRAGFENAAGSVTSDFLSGRKRVALPPKRRPVTKKSIKLKGARGNNLKAIDVTFPLGVLCLVTGVSGSGKSTLIEETLYPALRQRLAREAAIAAPFTELRVPDDIDDVVLLDHSPLARRARSNAVTYLRAFDEIRKTFAATHDARLRNYDAGRFSFNVEGGRCNACRGDGFLTVDMQFLPDVMIRCPECRGTRFRPEILEITYRGRNIAEVLDLTAREAFVFFRHRPKIQARLRPLLEIGLDYLRLGQPVSTLSGGEAQRLKLAGFLSRSLAALKRVGAPAPTVFLLDEPTVGLHPLDTLKLLDALGALVDRGHSVIAIEHRPEVMICADWLIDLGPGAGADGGRIVAQGTPEEVAQSGTPTGQVLAGLLGAAAE
jgi:excinuclease ABC subunit A